MTRHALPLDKLLTGRDTAPAFWMIDILWVPLVEYHVTGGAFSVVEQWMRKDSGAGSSVFVPRGTVHHFKVTSDVCHALNAYTPGGFEQAIKGLATPAAKRELPPPTFPKPNARTVELLSNNYWCAAADTAWARPDPAARRIAAPASP